ncbi:hypothetical protein AB0M47_16050 [Hamadaea sp. NPDC051192]|uniref:hypothetical protein n=1 Tax=Hamadaea sp. NPDC051192 TaxID=3154940 RepID=UPI003415A9F5
MVEVVAAQANRASAGLVRGGWWRLIGSGHQQAEAGSHAKGDSFEEFVELALFLQARQRAAWALPAKHNLHIGLHSRRVG